MKSIFLSLSLLSLSFGQKPGDNQVREGADAFYNYEYERSIEILDKARKNFSGHPGVHVAWVAAQWRNDESKLSHEEVYTNFDKNLDSIELIYDSLLAKNPDDPEYLLYYGSTKGLKARIQLGQKKWIPTLISAYRGFRIIQKVSELDSTLIDAYLPIGVVEYYIGMSNVLLKAGAELFGLEASKEEGIRKMEIAAFQSPWAWTEAKSILSFIYQFIDIDVDRGLLLSKDLADRYPNNYDFKIHYAESLLQKGELQLAKQLLDELKNTFYDQRPRHQQRFSSYLDYIWGHYHYLSGNDNKALGFLEQSINLYYSDLDAILGEAYLLKGKILDRQGKRMEAVISYKKCLKLDNSTNAMSLARIYLDDPFEG